MRRAFGVLLLLGLALAQRLAVDARAITWSPEPFPPARFPVCYTFARFHLRVEPPGDGTWLLTVRPEEGLDSEPGAAGPRLELRLLRTDGTQTRWIPLERGARVDAITAPIRYQVELRACFTGREWPGSYRTRLTWALQRAP